MLKKVYTPIFPDFKLLSLSDKDFFYQYLKIYDPYSDFNFTSLYCWDIEKGCTYSLLNNNLIIKFSGYENHIEAYAIIGINKLVDTITRILSYTDTIYFVPDIVVRSSKRLFSLFNIREDPDNFDYIYSKKHIVGLNDVIFKRKRYSIRKFNSIYPTSKCKEIDLRNNSTQKEIINLVSTWNSYKKFSNKKIEDSIARINNLFELSKMIKYLGIGVYVDEKLKAMCINEQINEEYCIQHFFLSDYDTIGISDFLFYETMKYIPCNYLNNEQDSGLVGLRQFKKSWRPVNILKKYIVSK